VKSIILGIGYDDDPLLRPTIDDQNRHTTGKNARKTTTANRVI
jgi:hypothetical protein